MAAQPSRGNRVKVIDRQFFVGRETIRSHLVEGWQAQAVFGHPRRAGSWR
jgi:hypothetical protein